MKGDSFSNQQRLLISKYQNKLKLRNNDNMNASFDNSKGLLDKFVH